MEEIFEITDRVAVLRDGKMIDIRPTKDWTVDDLVFAMVNRKVDQQFPAKSENTPLGDVVLRMKDVSNRKVHDINLEIRAGEIVGIAGINGAGRTELLKTIYGFYPCMSGVIQFYGKPLKTKSIRKVLNEGIVLVGRIGLAICFDMNFPKVWEAMAELNVELVIWPAAFSGGRNAALRAGTYHYYVATCTSIGQGDCRAADINGDWLMVKYPEEGRAVNRADITLDLDRTIFHKNYNEAGIAQIEKDYAGRVNVDRSLYYEEEWIVLSSEEKDLIRALCEEYGLVPLRQFKMHAMPEYIDARRCETIVK